MYKKFLLLILLATVSNNSKANSLDLIMNSQDLTSKILVSGTITGGIIGAYLTYGMLKYLLNTIENSKPYDQIIVETENFLDNCRLKYSKELNLIINIKENLIEELKNILLNSSEKLPLVSYNKQITSDISNLYKYQRILYSKISQIEKDVIQYRIKSLIGETESLLENLRKIKQTIFYSQEFRQEMDFQKDRPNLNQPEIVQAFLNEIKKDYVLTA